MNQDEEEEDEDEDEEEEEVEEEYEAVNRASGHWECFQTLKNNKKNKDMMKEKKKRNKFSLITIDV